MRGFVSGSGNKGHYVYTDDAAHIAIFHPKMRVSTRIRWFVVVLICSWDIVSCLSSTTKSPAAVNSTMAKGNEEGFVEENKTGTAQKQAGDDEEAKENPGQYRAFGNNENLSI